MSDSVAPDARGAVRLQRDLWKHRRGMAFTALWATLGVVPLMFAMCALATDAVVARVSQLQALIVGIVVPLVGLAGAYMGLATVYGNNTSASIQEPKG